MSQKLNTLYTVSNLSAVRAKSWKKRADFVPLIMLRLQLLNQLKFFLLKMHSNKIVFA